MHAMCVLYGALAQHPFNRLSVGDRGDLHRRGLTDEAIARHGYFTYSDTSGLLQVMRGLERFADHYRTPVARQWRKEHHGRLLQTELWALPGVYATGTRGRRGFVNRLVAALVPTGAGALGIPTWDADQRIVGIQLRLRDIDRVGTDVPRYKSLSTRQMPYGARVHVARPRTLTERTRIVITEGTIKANIAADMLGCIVIGLPGVACHANVLETLLRLRQLGELTDETQLLIAFDAETVPEKVAIITAARDRFAQMLVERDYHVTIAEWDAANGKGIDDLLTADHTFMARAYERKARRGLIQCEDVAPVSLSATHTSLESASAALRDLIEHLIPVRN